MRHLLLLILFNNFKIFAQDTSRRNEVFIEFGNHSLTTAVNYHRQLFGEKGLGIRTGIGSYSYSHFKPVVPVVINYRFKLLRKASYLDASAGITWTNADDVSLYASKPKPALGVPKQQRYFLPILSIVWVRQTKDNWSYRFGFSDVFTVAGGLPYIGFSIGRKF